MGEGENTTAGEAPADRRGQSADALRALAEGMDAPPGDPDEPGAAAADAPEAPADPFAAAPADEPADQADALAAVQAEAPATVEAPAIEGMGDGLSPAERAARAKRHTAISGQVHARQFRAFMIPLLLTVGGLLIVLGIAWLVLTAAHAAQGGGGAEALAEQPSRPGGALAVWLAALGIPLGAFLLFGAWWFRRELRRHEAPQP
jgi:hypothetical protein